MFPPEEYQNFLKYFVNAEENREKIIILYGYIPGDFYLNAGLKCCTTRIDSINLESPKHGVYDGDHAAELVQKAIEIVSHGANVDAVIKLKGKHANAKCNRSFGHSARATQLCQQDECTSALTEVMTARAPKLFIDECPVDERHQKDEVILTDWINKMNAALEKLISGLGRPNHQGEHLGKIRVFGRLQAPKKFNAEMDVNHRRVDYLLPADLLFGKEQLSSGMTLQEFLESIRESHPN